MTRNVKAIDLKPELEQKFNQLKQFFEIPDGDNFNEQFRTFLEKAHKYLFQNQQPETTIDIPCSKRFYHKDSYYCAYNPPRTKKLDTLEICKVCKAQKFGLRDKTLATTTTATTQTTTPKTEGYNALRDPKSNFSRYGMLYCTKETHWVYPSKLKTPMCQTCQNLTQCQQKAQPLTR